MKLPKPQTRKDYPKIPKTRKDSLQTIPTFSIGDISLPPNKFRKFKAIIKRHIAILLLAAGSIRTIYLEADNKVIVIAAGVILIVLLVEAAVSKGE